MVRNQGPGVALRLGFFEDGSESFKERPAIFIVEEDLSAFYSPGHDVLEEAWGIKSWLAGHGVKGVKSVSYNKRFFRIGRSS